MCLFCFSYPLFIFILFVYGYTPCVATKNDYASDTYTIISYVQSLMSWGAFSCFTVTVTSNMFLISGFLFFVFVFFNTNVRWFRLHKYCKSQIDGCCVRVRISLVLWMLNCTSECSVWWKMNLLQLRSSIQTVVRAGTQIPCQSYRHSGWSRVRPEKPENTYSICGTF